MLNYFKVRPLTRVSVPEVKKGESYEPKSTVQKGQTFQSAQSCVLLAWPSAVSCHGISFRDKVSRSRSVYGRNRNDHRSRIFQTNRSVRHRSRALRILDRLRTLGVHLNRAYCIEQDGEEPESQDAFRACRVLDRYARVGIYHGRSVPRQSCRASKNAPEGVVVEDYKTQLSYYRTFTSNAVKKNDTLNLIAQVDLLQHVYNVEMEGVDKGGTAGNIANKPVSYYNVIDADGNQGVDISFKIDEKRAHTSSTLMSGTTLSATATSQKR